MADEKKTKVKGISYGTPNLAGNMGDVGDAKVSVSLGSSPERPAPGGGGPAAEARAVVKVLEALEGLPADAVQRVLTVVVEEYNAKGGAGSSPQGQAAADDAKLGYGDLPAFIAGAGVTADSWRCLLVAYWMTVVEGAEHFSPTDLERELAQMQQPIDDIEDAFASLIGRRFVAEVPGQGDIQRYMLSPQGMAAVWSKFE